ncbi:MAG TPA: hypothetical protein DIU35_12510 [Candidatus Latescibacteria bacterium]|nr:hypothetical protein [Gemmatimonadota bacterium]HCR18296.1 hypothetical protein [Candidatus Latescibacterota bacterium]
MDLPPNRLFLVYSTGHLFNLPGLGDQGHPPESRRRHPLLSAAAPFFLGILAGYALAVTLFFLVDVVWFNGQGHRIQAW